MHSEVSQRFDATLRLRILHGFLAGESPSVATMAAALHAAESDVAAGFERLAAGRAIVLAPGTHDILMAAPFAGRRTDFRVIIDSQSYYANCIWDALGVSAMLGSVDAEIETRCPDCDEPLNLLVRQRGVIGEARVVHFAIPAARWWADIVFT
jgi:hypothetical protein